MWQEIISTIRQHQRFVITSHMNPDGDAIGSELALAEHLRRLGKDVAIINSDAVPKTFRFLDPQRRARRYASTKHDSVINKAEVIIVVDASGGWDRLGRIGKTLEPAKAIKLCIDHHPDATDFVDVAVIDTDAAATAELIYGLVTTMEGEITQSMAQALYIGLVTDTGSFRFPKTSPQTHRITANLLAAGANPTRLYRQIYEQYPLGLVRLKGHVLQQIQTAVGGQIAYCGLSRKTLNEYGVKSSELDGFASLGQQVGGVRLVIFCTEASKGRVKISLRSDGTVAINQIAQAYNGGGHPSAAGAIVPGKLDEILQELVVKATSLLENEA